MRSILLACSASLVATVGTLCISGCVPNGRDDRTVSPEPVNEAPQAPAPPPPEIGSVAATNCEGRKALALETLPSSTSISTAQQRAIQAIACDAYDVMAFVAASAMPRNDMDALLDGVRAHAAETVERLRAAGVQTSRLPLTPEHRQMYEAAAQAERASGAERLLAWSTNPWQPLHPLERPQLVEKIPLAISLMRGERRALAVNLRNTTESPLTLRVEVDLTSFPRETLQLYRVNWTGNDRSNWVAAELELLGDASSVRELELLPGITQQLWLEFVPTLSAQASRSSGQLVLRATDTVTQLPLDVTILKTAFPQEVGLHLGGWDYTDDPRPGYAVTETNRLEFAKLLQARHVDTPWAHSNGVLNWKFLGRDGSVTAPVDASLLERWVLTWPSARRFRVYVNVPAEIAGIPMTDDRFGSAVATWAHTWAAEIRRLGKSPEQFDLLLVDEPHTALQTERTETWARAVRNAGDGFRIWVDPFWSDPAQIPDSLIDAVDTVCVNAPLAQRAGDAYWAWARRVADLGKTIEIYNTSGPARRLDPYAAFRLLAWRGFFAGAKGVSFWSLSDTGSTGIGGSPSDNEFAAPGYNYSPLFIDDVRVRPGKHMEAIVEGLQDTEYLRMIEKIASTHSNTQVRRSAQDLLTRAADVLAGADSGAQWQTQRDRTQADLWRTAAGEFLDSTAP
jgi:hypothetical protein